LTTLDSVFILLTSRNTDAVVINDFKVHWESMRIHCEELSVQLMKTLNEADTFSNEIKAFVSTLQSNQVSHIPVGTYYCKNDLFIIGNTVLMQTLKKIDL
jgi:hypothetical protein